MPLVIEQRAVVLHSQDEEQRRHELGQFLTPKPVADFMASLFESRSAAFSRDNVLQENIIFHAVKDLTKPKSVTISSSSGAPGGLITEREADYRDVVLQEYPEQFIHLPGDATQDSARAIMSRLSATLSDLGVSVSTGRVVDFRAKEFLRQHPGDDTVSLK